MEKCISCNKEIRFFLEGDGFAIYKCPICGLGMTKKIDTQNSSYHRDEDYITHQKQFENIYKKRVNIIGKNFIKPGKILEIGSSTGLMLSLFKKRGWEILGIEISKKAAEFARKRGIPTLITSFELAKLSKNSFDAVVLNHTLEHLKNPEQVLKKVGSLLVRDGILFIDVPNFGGFSAKVYDKRWQYLLPNEHLWHFTSNSLEKLLTKNGFKITYIEKFSGIWDYQNPFLELWQSFITFKKRFFINFFTALPAYIISKLNHGSGLIIVAKKNRR